MASILNRVKQAQLARLVPFFMEAITILILVIGMIVALHSTAPFSEHLIPVQHTLPVLADGPVPPPTSSQCGGGVGTPC